MTETTKKEPWFNIKIRALEEEIATLKRDQNFSEFNLDSYCKGFYDCMSKYAIFAKGARRRIVQTIKNRYVGGNNMSYVWRVK